MNMYLEALLGFLLIQMPEEICLVTITLIFLKRYDLLDIRDMKRGIKAILIMASPMAAIMSVLTYLTKIDNNLISIFSVFVLITIVQIAMKKFPFESNIKYKIIICSILSYIPLVASEILYTNLLLLLTTKNMEYFGSNIFLFFLGSLPSRLILASYIFIKIIKKNNNVNVETVKYILRKKTVRNNFIILISGIIFTLIFVSKFIVVDEIIEKFSFNQQLAIDLFIIIAPIGIVFITWTTINCTLVYAKNIQQSLMLLSKEDCINDWLV